MLGAADCREGRNEGQWGGGLEGVKKETRKEEKKGRKGRKLAVFSATHTGTNQVLLLRIQPSQLDLHEDLHGGASRRTRLDLLSWWSPGLQVLSRPRLADTRTGTVLS